MSNIVEDQLQRDYVDDVVPEVWYGPDGIDALLWADPPPLYAYPPAPEACKPYLSESRTPCVTTAELVQIDQQLSERERQVIRLLSTLTLMSGAQLRRICFPDEKTGRGDGQVARRVLLRLTRRGLLVRLQRRIGGIKRGSDGFTYRLVANCQD